MDLFLFFSSAALSFAGCLCLALSQSRNWRTIGGTATPPKPLRAVGALVLLLALIMCVLRDGGSFAALLWPLLFAASALAVAMLLAFRPQLLTPLARRAS